MKCLLRTLHEWFDEIELSEYDTTVGKRILIEIKNRLKTLMDVGLVILL